MNEASKTRAARSDDFYSIYLNDSVLDIGCGPDLVVPHATPFDQEDGDANEILNYFKPESFFCVHSSHCLEHMKNPCKSILDWWALVKPGGYLITVVPDGELYEQGYWPSLFNSDHKSMFCVNGVSKYPEMCFNIKDLMSSLPGANVISVKRQDNHYCHWKALIPFRAPRLVRSVFSRTRGCLMDMKIIDGFFDQALVRIGRLINVPVDQTLGKAMAQIEVVAQKQK
jgi:SAM-dependent methyltransferase